MNQFTKQTFLFASFFKSSLPIVGKLLSLALILTTFFALSAQAQTTTADLSGTVADETGAVVPNVTLRAINTATNLERQVKTNDDGAFTIPLLPPGSYTLRAERAGFAPVEINDVVLNVNDRRTIRVNLRVGAVGATVTVENAPPLIDESPAVSTVVDRQFIENQPLNGRSFQTLVELSPGVTLTQTGVGNQGQFSVNGQRTNTNYFTIDGVSANFGSTATATAYESSGGTLPPYSAIGGTNTLASVDSVQEFTIQTSTYAPEFGRQPGAQVQIITRSGTNLFNGSVFDYVRNDKFDANDWFANRNRIPRQVLRQNDFGFVVGGPVFLPRFGEGTPFLYDGRDKTFFFVSYEGLRLRTPVTSQPYDVPSRAVRQQATGLAKLIVDAFPLPTGPARAGSPAGTETFIAGYSNSGSLDATSVRIDHNFSNRVSIFGRYNYSPSESIVRADFSLPNNVGVFPADTRTLTFGSTAVFTSRFSNDVRVNFSKATEGSRYYLDTFGGAIVPPDSLLFAPFTGIEESISTITIGGNNALTPGFNVKNTQRQLNVVNTSTFTFGSHNLKFGVDYRRLTPTIEGPKIRRRLVYTNANQILTGSVPNVTVAASEIVLRPIYNNYSAFVQDTWRTTQRLTLTYGLRYEVNPSPTEANGNLPILAGGIENLSALTLRPPGSRFYETTFNNFAPRIGATYQISKKLNTVVRGGFGVFYDLGYNFTGSTYSRSTAPYGNSVAYTNLALTSPLLNAQIPTTSALAPPYSNLFAFAPNYKLPYTLQYNVAVEQAVGGKDVVTLSYVGAIGRRLGRAERIQNPSPPQFTRLNLISNNASSEYNALQAQYQRRFSRGFQATAAYTFAKSTDTVSDETITNYQPRSDRYDPEQDRGPSSFDVRHSFTGALSYEIPSPFERGIGKTIFGGFAIDGIFRARSATPVNILTNQDPFNLGFISVSRPDLIAGQPLYIEDSNEGGGKRINPAAFDRDTPRIQGRQGTLGRNALRGFSLWQTDISLRRKFNFTERLNLQLKIDAFNVFNRPNFANPIGILGDGNFGRSIQMFGRSLGAGGTNGGLNPLYQIGGQRSLQLSAKIQF